MSILQKLTAGALTSAAFMTIFAGATFASTTVTISGNGAGSLNTAGVTNSFSHSLSQSNLSFISTGVLSGASSGGNVSASNTGTGAGHITTGPAGSSVGVATGGSSNHAVSHLPCGCPGDTAVTISENGDGSSNTAWVTNLSSSSVTQDNTSFIGTEVMSSADSGGNTSVGNTGGASGGISTGGASSGVSVTTTGSSNTSL